jgi:hypothetical protein
MKKSEIERSYHNGTRGYPMLNVKHHFWWPDIVRKYKGVTAKNRRVGTYFVHEYGDAEQAFWDWATLEFESDWSSYCAFETADQIAREVGWEDAGDFAKEVFGPHAKVFSLGRSGGWLGVDNLGDVDDWDAVMVSRWARFARGVQALVDDLDYQFLWHLYVNVYETLVVEPRKQTAKAAAEATAEMERWVNAGLVMA